MDYIKGFLGFSDSLGEPQGAYSWQHLTFVTSLVLIMFALAITIGLHYRKNPDKNKNIPLIWAAVLIDAIEIFKIVLNCIHAEDPVESLLVNLPLFLCSIQLIALPLAAFSKGRLKEAALDFVLIFGLLGALAGTYGAAQNYAAYHVFYYVNVVSGITHCISGFGALYIGFSGLASLKKKNIGITFAILGSFCVVAYIVNRIIDYNYMFLMSGDGTPYDILYNLVGGNPVLYPIGVVVLFLIYITAFYLVYFLISRKRNTNYSES